MNCRKCSYSFPPTLRSCPKCGKTAPAGATKRPKPKTDVSGLVDALGLSQQPKSKSPESANGFEKVQATHTKDAASDPEKLNIGGDEFFSENEGPRNCWDKRSSVFSPKIEGTFSNLKAVWEEDDENILHEKLPDKEITGTSLKLNFEDLTADTPTVDEFCEDSDILEPALKERETKVPETEVQSVEASYINLRGVVLNQANKNKLKGKS